MHSGIEQQMTSYQVEAEILRKEEIASSIFRLTLASPEIAQNALPGQFVMANATEKASPLLRRPFSIHQATSNERIQILIKVLGKGTRYLSQQKPGKKIGLLGPLGTGFDLRVSNPDICLVGGGMGIAPLFFLAKHMCRHFPEKARDLVILIGAATSSELTVLKNDFENLGVKIYTATDDGSEGYHGFVTDLIKDKLNTESPVSLYTCGPRPMMKKLAEMSIKNKWNCQVSLETMMACGISACLGCTVESSVLNNSKKYLHVCKDGPVFSAGDVSWD